MEYKDYYKTLGVAKDASEKDIKSAYRKLARKYHPDVNKEKGATERFKELNEANAVLSDPEKRKKYDQLGSNWQAYDKMGGSPPGGAGRRATYTWGGQGADAGGFDFSDFFQMFFGGSEPGQQRGGNPFEGVFRSAGGGRGTDHGMRAAPEQEAQIEVTLEEVAKGSERRISLGDQTATVTIPKGIREGMKLRIPAQKSGAGADIYLVVKYARHSVYTLDGDDLVAEVDVPVTKAVLGGEIEVPTLQGSVKMKIPALTQGGRVLRLRGRGLPQWKSEEIGDQLVRIRLVIPESLSDKEKKLYEELAQLRSGTR